LFTVESDAKSYNEKPLWGAVGEMTANNECCLICRMESDEEVCRFFGAVICPRCAERVLALKPGDDSYEGLLTCLRPWAARLLEGVVEKE